MKPDLYEKTSFLVTEALSATDASASDVQRDRLTRFLLFLHDKLKLLRLTASRDMEVIVRDHVVDALLLHRTLLSDGASGQMIDIGSGNGFPAIPCAIMNRDLHVWAVEARAKRVAFLRMAVNDISLELKVLEGRVEDLIGESIAEEGFDVATARAVAAPERVIDMVFPLLRPKGRFYAQLGHMSTGDQASYKAHVSARGGTIVETHELGKMVKKDHGVIVVIEKTKK